ncbi:MAG: hypothetical protein NTZ33_03990 [Bacteroidetes bacterium]|nr:hypothetical protein [Bacteroidota bacterium]
MNPFVKRLLLWTPRILSILFALFVGLISIAVFGAYDDTLLVTLSYLLPAIIILFALLFAWKWEWVGAIVYFLIGIAYLGFIWNVQMALVDNLIFASFITGPSILIASLFFLSWYYRNE